MYLLPISRDVDHWLCREADSLINSVTDAQSPALCGVFIVLGALVEAGLSPFPQQHGWQGFSACGPCRNGAVLVRTDKPTACVASFVCRSASHSEAGQPGTGGAGMAGGGFLTVD